MMQNICNERRFRDRAEAGGELARQLTSYSKHPQAIVLALPRGGVPVAYPIAQTLQIPLDLCLVHKLGVPDNSEVAMGAIDLQGRRYINERMVAALKITSTQIDRVAHIELRELQRRDRLYRGDRTTIDLQARIAILVDDGLATGATMSAAIEVVRLQHPDRIVVAVPVTFRAVVDGLRTNTDRLVYLRMPALMSGSIGSWYENFAQTTDDEVIDLLNRSTVADDNTLGR
jgi:putative phosphoribosyl transferase